MFSRSFIWILLVVLQLINQVRSDDDDDDERRKGFGVAYRFVRKNLDDLVVIRTPMGASRINESSISILLKSHCALLRQYTTNLPGYCYSSQVMSTVTLRVCRRLLRRGVV